MSQTWKALFGSWRCRAWCGVTLLALMAPALAPGEPALTGIGDVPPQGRSSSASQALLYRVSPANGAAPSYLFATIHSEDQRVLQLPDSVRAAFEGSVRFALEVVPDNEAIIKSMMTMTYTDGRTLADVLPPKLYHETSAALHGLGMTTSAFRDFKPWAVVTLISVPPGKTGEFLDLVLYRAAVAAGKEVRGLETMDEQLAIFDQLALCDQVALLRETLDARGDFPAMFESLVLAYLAQDLDTLMERSDRYLEGGDPMLAALFRLVVVDTRNQRMAERMAPLLDQGGWFIAVGALHLPGSEGILRRLELAGHRIEPVH